MPCQIFIIGNWPHTPPIWVPFLSFCACTHQRIFRYTGLLATTFIFKEYYECASILRFAIVVLHLSFIRKTMIIKQTQCVLCACHWAKHLQIILLNSSSNSTKDIYFLIRKLRHTKAWGHTTHDLLGMELTYPTFLGWGLRNYRNVLYFIIFLLRFFPQVILINFIYFVLL